MRRPTLRTAGAILALSATLGAAAIGAAGSSGAIAVSTVRGSAPCLLPTAFNAVTALKAATGLRRDAIPNQYDLPTPTTVRPFFAGPRTVEVYFHVIRASLGGAGDIPDQWITDQIQILNDAYSGQGAAAGSVDTGFRFHLAAVDRTDNPVWYDGLTPGSSVERQMKKALHRGGYWDLNLYSANLGGGLLGWAYFPKAKARGTNLTNDGVVLLDESLPGGSAEGGGLDYHEGDTATHEVGHWLSLYHTFQGGCRDKGDQVADTPAEAGPNFDCTPVDSCPKDGLGADLIHNFMDYGDDICLDSFTAGQVARMQANWDALRNIIPDVKKFKPTKAAAGATVVIRGIAFSGASNVSFNGTPSTYTVVDDETIDVTVPVGATTGKISVTNANGAGISQKTFTALP